MQVEASLHQLIHSEEGKRSTQRKRKRIAKFGIEDVRKLSCGEALTVEINTHFHKLQTIKLDYFCSGHPLL